MSASSEEGPPFGDELPEDNEDEENGGASAADEAEDSFAGSLLVAHPSLKDSNFRRSVLYLSAHTRSGGAFGIILNRPLGTTAAALLPQHDRRELLSQVPVYHGGPVGQDQLSFAQLRWDQPAAASARPATCRLRCHLALDEVMEFLSSASSPAPTQPGGMELRAVVGYAGWSGGQLEAEMKERAWLLVKPPAEVFAQPASVREEKMWFRILSSLGPAYKLQAAAPDDPSLN